MNSLSNDGNNNNNNWLGFTLSPQMEGHGPSNAPVSSFPHTPPPHMNCPIVPYYVGQGDTKTPTRATAAAFFSSLSVMPLKSDGSLCLMEALNRSQPQGMGAATPKLEDCIGMGAHDYDIRSGGMALSLDNMYNQDYQMPTAGMKSFCINNTNAGVSKDGGESWAPDNGATGYGDLRALSLSMSHGSSRQSHQQQQQQETLASGSECGSKKRGLDEVLANNDKQIVHRKSLDTFGQRTSQYRGVTRHRWTGRYEAHLWDNSCMKEGQSRKGKQVYLGGYDNEEKAARAYDLAAIKYWGPSTHINFPLDNYHQELEGMKNMTRQEYVAHLRRKSSGFSRGASIYRGVTRHHQHGRWQARIGRVAGNKDLYLGTFGTQEEAAEAYDIAAIKFRGVNAVTNFDSSTYDIERIMASNDLLARDQARRPSKISLAEITADTNSQRQVEENFEASSSTQTAADWRVAVYQQGVVDESAAPLRRPFFAAWTDNVV